MMHTSNVATYSQKIQITLPTGVKLATIEGNVKFVMATNFGVWLQVDILPL